MREISLSQGQVTLVDDEDYEYLSQWRWYANLISGKFYAVRTVKKPSRQTILMHRVILNAQEDELVDHKDDNGLRNTRENLRITDRSGNGANRNAPSSNTSGYKGVSR